MTYGKLDITAFKQDVKHIVFVSYNFFINDDNHADDIILPMTQVFSKSK